MIIFLSGPDTFRSREHLHRMVAKFKKDRDPQGLNVVQIDCEKESNPSSILNEIMAMPFLADRRMIVLENFLLSKLKETQQDILKRIEEKRLPESNVIIFWEGISTWKTKEAKALAERLGQEKFAQEFSVPTGVKLGGWIIEEVGTRGGQITKPAVQFLVTHAGSDMWRLTSLLDQLISYKHESEIDVPDVQLFLDEKVDDNIFTLVDAIVGGSARPAYIMIREQYRQGEDVQYIFAMVVRQFRILLQLRDLFERGDNLPSDVMAKQLGLHPFVVKKSLPLVRRYTMEHLRSIYDALLRFDIATKTGGGDPAVLLDVFVSRVCAITK